MPTPTPTPGRTRFVLLSQQTFTLAVVGALTLSAAGVVQLEIVAPQQRAGAVRAGGSGPGVSLVSSAPVTPTVRTVPFGGLSAQLGGERAGDHPATGEDGAQRISAISPPVRATGYATVGVTWAADAALDDDEITVSVRTKADGAWTSWQEIHYDAHHRPDPGSAEADAADAAAVPGTDAVVVGDVDDVQVRTATTSGEAPAGLALAVVDPG